MCSFFVCKNTCLNYREFDLEGDLVGVPHTWYLSAQPFITLLKLIWGEYDIVAMNEWKKKCVGLQRTWGRTKSQWRNASIINFFAYLFTQWEIPICRIVMAFLIFNKFPATYAFHMCVEYDKTKQPPSKKIW